MLAWEIPWKRTLSGYSPWGLKRFGPDLATACCLVASVMSNSVRPHRRQPTRLPCPWDYPGKNTGVGCHFLLQCMKVKSESEVVQSCPTPSDPMDCSPPGSSIHGIFQARVLEWGAIAFSQLNNNKCATGGETQQAGGMETEVADTCGSPLP